MTLRLYVWHQECSDWHNGIIFALAHSVEEARAEVCKTDLLLRGYTASEPSVYESAVGFVCLDAD